ncbi:MAG: hypothetical protein ACI9VR_003259 [Cognaticolwellia sp.]|jgi:hypothetical protein
MTQFSALFLVATAVAAFQPGPPGGQDGERRGPPPEALEVCATQEEGDPCSFEGRRGTAEGTCEAPPHGEGALACRPDDAPPPPQERPE